MPNLLTKIAAHSVKPKFTEVAVGDTVRVYTRIKEGEKERTQYFEGLVIRRRGGIGPNASFTVRRIASGVGVERTFPVHAPTVERIVLQRTAKVRRATLYTMRGLTGKAARLTEKKLDKKARQIEHPWIKKYGITVAKPQIEEATKATKPEKAEKKVEKAETRAEAKSEPARQEKPKAESTGKKPEAKADKAGKAEKAKPAEAKPADKKK